MNKLANRLFFLVVFVVISSFAVLADESFTRWGGTINIDGNSSGSYVDNASVLPLVDGVATASWFIVGNPANSGYYIANVDCNTGQTVQFKINGVFVYEATQTCSAGAYYPFNLSANMSASSGNCTYGYTWSDAGCAGSLVCCSDNLCKSSCTTTTTTTGGGGGGGGATGGGGGAACTSNWACTDYLPLECPESGIQARTCTDQSGCGTPSSTRPPQERTCTYTAPVAVDLDTSAEVTITVSEGDTKRMKYAGKQYDVKVVEVGDTYMKLSITYLETGALVREVILEPEIAPAEVDLDTDGESDITIDLTELAGETGTLTFGRVGEEKVTPPTPEEEQKEVAKPKMPATWWVVAIIVLVLAVAVYLVMAKKKK